MQQYNTSACGRDSHLGVRDLNEHERTQSVATEYSPAAPSTQNCPPVQQLTQTINKQLFIDAHDTYTVYCIALVQVDTDTVMMSSGNKAITTNLIKLLESALTHWLFNKLIKLTNKPSITPADKSTD